MKCAMNVKTLKVNKIFVILNSARENEIYRSLTRAARKNGHFKVYNKENIPRRWHANNTRRLGPIIAIADIGYGFQDLFGAAEYYKKAWNIPSESLSIIFIHLTILVNIQSKFKFI